MQISVLVNPDVVAPGGVPDGMTASIPLFAASESASLDKSYPYQRDAVGRYMVHAPSGLTVTAISGGSPVGWTRNPYFQGPEGYNSNIFINAGGPGVTLYRAGEKLSPPFTLVPGDVLVLFKQTTSSWLGRGPNGLWEEIHVIDQLYTNPQDRLAPEATRGADPYLTRQVSPEIDWAARLAVLGDWPRPSSSIPVAVVLDKMRRYRPALTHTAVDTNPGGYEAEVPVGFLFDEATPSRPGGQSGYSREQGFVWAAACQHMVNPANTLAERIELAKWLTYTGDAYFRTRMNDITNVCNNGGGHFSGHTVPAIVSLFMRGEKQLLRDYGTPLQTVRDNTEQFGILNKTLIATMVPHTNPNWPHSWRHRQLVSVGSGTVTLEWDRNAGDIAACRTAGLELRRAGDPVSYYGTSTVDAAVNPTNGNTRVTITVADDGSGRLPGVAGLPSIVGQQVYWAPQWTPAVGQPYWSIQGFVERGWPNYGYVGSVPSLATLNGCIRAQYQVDTQNQSFETVAWLIGLMGREDPALLAETVFDGSGNVVTPGSFWEPIIDQVIISNRPNYPGRGLLDVREWSFGGSDVTGLGYVVMKDFFVTHAPTIFGSKRYNKSLGWVGLVN